MHSRLWIAGACALLLLLGLAPAAGETVINVPIVGKEYQAPADLVTLVDSDSTYISATLAPAGCVFMAYIDRAHGNRLHVVRDAGDHVVEVPLPPLAQQVAQDPAFTAPGDKQAAGALLFAGSRMLIYYTSRDEGDPSGIFKLKRLNMPAPSCS